ncbi:macrolide 2'-phosphotransferase [Saxibacter everestensis]|uniref:Macrolide 2'-phosphotransferase n=1 Tax=Saxibacter everestensis TaxID=2909229 RepID=A0ABY8QX15_9MICO|nr:macrolide 2'-phosphotransferase [Brevibacteriaceae bacterium ZFBP1038]
MRPRSDDVQQILDLASRHELSLEQNSLSVIEAGLDFRVVLARANDGTDWVLRIPRRADVSDRLAAEARILDFVGQRLDVAVPDWQVTAPDLIAYPLLPGRPGLTIDETSGEPLWHFDRESLRYAEDLGRLIAALHGLSAKEAKVAGLQVQDADESRAEWEQNVQTVRAEFKVAPDLVRRWENWIADDSFWPIRTVLTHGELYPAHVLIADDETITAVLDWTTAKVGDPALDFMFQKMIAGERAFAATVDAYHKAGGRTWPRLGDHCAEIVAASPVAYGIYALTTGESAHLDAAAAQLNPVKSPAV